MSENEQEGMKRGEEPDLSDEEMDALLEAMLSASSLSEEQKEELRKLHHYMRRDPSVYDSTSSPRNEEKNDENREEE